MEQKEVEIKMHLHTLAVKRFADRRAMEWRFLFTLWALLLGLTFGIGEIADRDVAFWIVFSVGVAATGFHIAFQLVYVYHQMKRDWITGIDIDRDLREEIDMSTSPLPACDQYRPWWAHGWQPTITAVIWIATLVALWSN